MFLILKDKQDCRKKYKYFDVLVLILSGYCLFIWRSWKLVKAPTINNIHGTNEIYLVAAVCFILLLMYLVKERNTLRIPLSHPGIVYFILIVYVIIRDLLLPNCNSQNIYALAICFLPMMLAVLPQERAKKNIKSIIIPLSIVLTLYSFAGIISFFTNNQLRLSLPLGVATTLVFLFIVAIPIINLGINMTNNKAISVFLQIGFWMTIVVSILTVSRAGIPVVGIVAVWCLFEKSKKKKVATRIFGIIIALLIIAFIISFFVNIDSKYIELSRLWSGFSDSSTSERGKAAILGIEIFKNNVLFGAGNGTYFTRIYTFTYWTDKLIFAYGKIGLLDPHNLYILILSENGMIGFTLFSIFIVKIIKRIKSINDRSIRIAGIQMLVGIALYSMTSSDMFSVVGLSAIIWYILGAFISYSYRDVYD